MVKVYAIVFGYAVASGFGANTQFELQSNNREIKIKSIAINTQFTAAGLIIPEESNTLIDWTLAIGSANTQIALPFVNIAGVVPISNGDRIYFYRSGQQLFDSFFVKNKAVFNLTCMNNSPDAASLSFSIVVETEENIIYQWTIISQLTKF